MSTTAHSYSCPDILCPDDNFASTVSKYTPCSVNHVTNRSAEGVAEGRQIFVNLKRSIQLVISEHVGYLLIRWLDIRYRTVHPRSLLNFSVSIISAHLDCEGSSDKL